MGLVYHNKYFFILYIHKEVCLTCKKHTQKNHCILIINNASYNFNWLISLQLYNYCDGVKVKNNLHLVLLFAALTMM